MLTWAICNTSRERSRNKETLNTAAMLCCFRSYWPSFTCYILSMMKVEGVVIDWVNFEGVWQQ